MLNTRLICICFSICCLSAYLRAQPPAFKMQSYIEMYSEEAIYQMLEYKVPASVTLAQAIFESQSGGSYLARKSNNHFGIKCHLEWGGDTVAKHDDTLNECFRKYRLVADSYTDHSMFLRSRARYASLFDLPLDDYRSWCFGLKAAGYATYPSYAEDLITIIEQFRLYELDGYQSLDAVNVFNQRNHEAIPGPPLPNCSLQDLARTGLLWTNEKDLLIQSLELLIENPGEMDEGIAAQSLPIEDNEAKTPAVQYADSCEVAGKAEPKGNTDSVKQVLAEPVSEMANEIPAKEVPAAMQNKEIGPEQLPQGPEPCETAETMTSEKTDSPAVQVQFKEIPNANDNEPLAEDNWLMEPMSSGYNGIKP
jgi:hypothetical protein